MTIGHEFAFLVTSSSLKENWEELRKSLLEHDAPDEQIEATEAAYYSGAAVAILNFRRMLKIKSQAAAKKVWDTMYDDVEEHMAAFMSSPPSDAVRH